MNRPNPSRRQILQGLLNGLLGIAAFSSGCQSFRNHFRSKSDEEGQVCLQTGTTIPRRIYVTTPAHRQLIVGGNDYQFVQEVIAALNSLPQCNAILLPPHYSVETMMGPDGIRPAMMDLPEVYVPDAALEELLLIDVVEMIPYRPMRLRAILERRSLADGMILSREHRTWNAPADNEPLAPSKFNRFILRHPQPLAEVESQELARLSPQTFLRNVAQEVAVELTAFP